MRSAWMAVPPVITGKKQIQRKVQQLGSFFWKAADGAGAKIRAPNDAALHRGDVVPEDGPTKWMKQVCFPVISLATTRH